MSFFSDLKAINKVVFKKTNESYSKNIFLIPMLGLYIVAYAIFSYLLGITVGRLGSAGGFLAGIIGWFFSCYMISDYLTHLENAVNGFKFKFSEIGKNYMRYFMPALTATAIPNIIVSLFMALTRIPVPSFLILFFYLVYATPEVIYQKDLDRLEIFAYGHNFIKENWQHWLLINGILGMICIGLYMLMSRFVLVPLMGALVTMPELLNVIIFSIVQAVLSGIPLLYYLIYRGYIFKILSVSSRRKREYMRNIYGK
ncbi:hypothetical protein EZV73_22420 [Acidaminobacter sp. JC074]|uniref:hypothetical protein n=1 Tax=Acidaminobacter sp. JC074 TaxID=2530199 RepID=UPI001F0E3F05|nr:hypothetical protein [Acidaminobacter sp. JC074]MCH4890355.1 hypothetical protein [Acidaminobacter sp. JC074]